MNTGKSDSGDSNGKPYRITTLATTARQETEVTLIGPGLETAGQRYVFASRQRAETLVASMNLAYDQGVREGLEIARVGAGRADEKPKHL